MTNQIDLIVQGAQLVTSSDMAQIDLYVHEGKVIGLGRLDLSSKEVVDGKGLFLLPGMVDAHVHFMDPGDPTREDFPTGSAAAAVAGVTTVVEHSHGSRVTNGETLRKKAEYLKDRSVIDFALGAHFSPNGLEEIEEVLREGAAFIKVFTCTTHGVDAVENGRLFQAMRNFASAGVLYLVHAEDESLTRVAEAELRGAGREDGMVIPGVAKPSGRAGGRHNGRPTGPGIGRERGHCSLQPPIDRRHCEPLPGLGHPDLGRGVSPIPLFERG